MKMQKNSIKPRITKCYGVVVTDAKGHQYILTGDPEPRAKVQAPYMLKFIKDGYRLGHGEAFVTPTVTTTKQKWEATGYMHLVRDLIETMRYRPAIVKPYKIDVVTLRITAYPMTIEVLA